MLLILIISIFLNSALGYKIAICITGMPARFQPRLLSTLFEDNPDISFNLFYRFQDDSSLLYTTEPRNKYQPSIFASYDKETLEVKVKELYKKFEHVDVSSIKYTTPKTRDQWLKEVGSFEPIVQYIHLQERILNMFEKADHCAQDVRDYQAKNGISFDYIIHTREDMFFFQKVDLKALIAKYSDCDWIGKDCLSWGGLSMRFAVMKPEKGLDFVGSKIAFFKQMGRNNSTAHNPEIFDIRIAESLQMKTCAVPVDEVPATGARHTWNGAFCFIWAETLGCIPKGQEQFAYRHRC